VLDRERIGIGWWAYNANMVAKIKPIFQQQTMPAPPTHCNETNRVICDKN